MPTASWSAKISPTFTNAKETRFCSSTNGANRFRVLGLGRRNPTNTTFSPGRQPKVDSCQGKPATTGRQNLPTCRRKWVTLTGSGLVAIPREPPVRGTRRMRVEAAPIPLPAECWPILLLRVEVRNGALMATSRDQFTHWLGYVIRRGPPGKAELVA